MVFGASSFCFVFSSNTLSYQTFTVCNLLGLTLIQCAFISKSTEKNSQTQASVTPRQEYIVSNGAMQCWHPVGCMCSYWCLVTSRHSCLRTKYFDNASQLHGGQSCYGIAWHNKHTGHQMKTLLPLCYRKAKKKKPRKSFKSSEENTFWKILQPDSLWQTSCCNCNKQIRANGFYI